MENYLVKASNKELAQETSNSIARLLLIIGDYERIGDHAINIAGYSRMIKEKGIKFSEMAQKEIVEMQKTCKILFSILLEE